MGWNNHAGIGMTTVLSFVSWAPSRHEWPGVE